MTAQKKEMISGSCGLSLRHVNGVAARRANWVEYPMVENEGRCCKNFLA